MKSLLLLGLLAASPFEANFTRGAAAYDAGDYPAAAQAFQQLVDSQVTAPEVFYNLGNAYFRMGELGQAIANYERALHLDPRLEPARQNLNSALRRTERNLPRPRAPEWQEALFFWDEPLAPHTVRWMAFTAWVLFWVLLGLHQWRALPYLRLIAVAVLGIAALFGTSAWLKARPQPLAVAVEQTVPIRYGTSEADTVRFELYEGDRVLVDRRENDWLRVTTAGGERGWARAEQLAPGVPPRKTPYFSPRGRG